MTERFGALYHWSPTSRRPQIIRYGLRPLQRPTMSSGEDGFRQPHVCLGTTPSAAWGLSGGLSWAPDGEWDLWQVRLGPTDDVRIRPQWGDIIEEIQVSNRIMKRQIWYVGSRTK